MHFVINYIIARYFTLQFLITVPPTTLATTSHPTYGISEPKIYQTNIFWTTSAALATEKIPWWSKYATPCHKNSKIFYPHQCLASSAVTIVTQSRPRGRHIIILAIPNFQKPGSWCQIREKTGATLTTRPPP